jgi:hypothetical protein
MNERYRIKRTKLFKKDLKRIIKQGKDLFKVDREPSPVYSPASVVIPSLRATAGSAAIHRRGLCAWIAARRLRRRSQ